MGQSPLSFLRQLMLLCLLVLPLFGHAGDEPPTNSDFASELKHFKELSKQQLSSTRELLQRDIQAQGQRLDVQEKRFDDHSKRLDGQDERLNAQDQRLSTVDSHIDLWISGFGLLATLLGVVIPLTAFFSVKNKASEEARKVSSEEAKLWFEKQSTELRSKLQALSDKSKEADREVTALRDKLHFLEGDVAAHAKDIKDGLTQHSDTQKQELKAAKEAILADMKSADVSGISVTARQQQVVIDAGRSALDKPESQYDWDDWDDRAIAALAEHDLKEAIRCWDKIIQMKSVPAEEQARAMYNKGVALGRQNQPEAALAAYDELIQRFMSDATEDIRLTLARAMLNKGVAIGQNGQPETELAIYEELIQLFEKDTTESMREQLAKAIFNKGVALGRQGQPEGELAAYDQLIQNFGNDKTEALDELIASAMFNQGIALGQLNQNKAALAACDKLIQRFNNDKTEGIRLQISKAMLNKGVILNLQHEPEAALAVFDELIQRFGNDTNEDIRQQVAMTIFNKGIALDQQNQPEAVLNVYNELIQHYGNNSAEGVRKQIVWAMHRKAIILNQLSQFDAALAAFDELIRCFGNDTAENIREQVAKAQNSKGFTLLCHAKLHWSDTAARSADLLLHARQLLAEALTACSAEDKGFVLGNQSYCAHLLGEPLEIVRPTLKQALEIRGEALYKATLEDLTIHPVPEKDELFRALLEEVWSEVQAEKEL